MSSNELQALFSNLKPRSQERSPVSPAPATSTQHSSRPSSSLFHQAQAPSTPPPPFTPVETTNVPTMDKYTNQTRVASSATAQNLLNLLNFGGPQSSVHASSQSSSTPNNVAASQQTGGNPISASDLVARFISPTTTIPRLDQKEDNTSDTHLDHETSRDPSQGLQDGQTGGSFEPSPTENEEHYEIQDSADEPLQSIETAVETMISDQQAEEARESPVRLFGASDGRDTTPFDPPKSASPMPQANKLVFTYSNPFEALKNSRQQTPKAPSPVPEQNSTPANFDFKAEPAMSSPNVISARKKLTPKLRSQRSITPAHADQIPGVSGFEGDDQKSTVHQPSEAIMQSDPQSAATAQPHDEDQTVNDENDTVDKTEMPAEGSYEENQEGSGEWEDADESLDKPLAPREVPVYNFPIKAFVSITLQLSASSGVGIREDGVMEISRLKKDFDQLDRSLAAATSRYITYAFVKNGGMRIIRQDDGSDRHVFKNSHDRIFNVAFCTTATSAQPSENQAVLGTGISGAVYYANVSKEGNDLFEKNQLESESLIFPPHPQADENTAGGVLKTRAKRSSRHPEYFAIGRGKSINIVWPATALSSRYGVSDTNRVVDVEKFYSDRPLQISTGKAGKDFTFSDDDTLIVSLDKTGRLRFWDIRNLVDESNATAARVNPIVVDTPILSLSTASPAEKSWPTSVTFVDKARPYKKGGALRYVLVGLRQNHTLQLWDIALGKAVQEVNFPHENETDGICSVSYHPESGIIVVSHPTRNSIFFIHLSAPRYSLSSQISQASYVQRIAAKDPELPKPESTACMSGIREISFAEKGQLRSVELLPIHKSSDAPKDDSASFFELYVVHSKGVTCLGINREDLGWNTENKVLHPVDALQEQLVSLKELKLGSVIEEPTRSKSPPKEALQPTKNSKKKAKKQGQTTEEVVNANGETQPPAPSPSPPSQVLPETIQVEPVTQEIPAPKESKKAKKKAEKAAQQIQQAEQVVSRAEPHREPSPVKSILPQANGKHQVVNEDVLITRPEPQLTGISEEHLSGEMTKIERAVSSEFRKELDALYQNIQSDRNAHEASSASRQEAVLRLVSTSLSTNVEKSLSRILAQQMQQTIVPVVVQQTSAQIADTLGQNLRQSLPHEIGTHLPAAINTALQSPHLSKTVAETVSQKLSKHLETQVTDMVMKSVTPVLARIATSAAEKASSETEARLSAQLRQMQIDRAADNEKIERLNSVLQGMASTLQAMSDSQVAFQGQILKDRQALAIVGGSSTVSTSRQVSTARGTPDPAPAPKPKAIRIRSKADIELEDITNLMNEGRYEEGSIKWLQSAQPVKLFDELFVRFTPEYLATDVSPLVAFSVAVTVANSLSTNTERRLEWISSAFDAVDLQDPEIADLSQHAPALITSLIQKLESLYMTIAERSPSDPILRSIPALAKKGRDMKTAFIASASGPIVPTLSHLASASF